MKQIILLPITVPLKITRWCLDKTADCLLGTYTDEEMQALDDYIRSRERD